MMILLILVNHVLIVALHVLDQHPIIAHHVQLLRHTCTQEYVDNALMVNSMMVEYVKIVMQIVQLVI